MFVGSKFQYIVPVDCPMMVGKWFSVLVATVGITLTVFMFQRKFCKITKNHGIVILVSSYH